MYIKKDREKENKAVENVEFSFKLGTNILFEVKPCLSDL